MPFTDPNHPITVTLTGMQSFYTGSDQGTAEPGEIDVTHQSPVMFSKYFEDIGKGKHLTSFIGQCRPKMTAKDLFFGHDSVKIQIVALYLGFLFGSKPVTFTGKQLMAKLGIKLVVIDICTVDPAFHIHTDETAGGACR